MTFDSVSQYFAFGSGATKLPRIQGHDSFLTTQFGFLLFAFRHFCEIQAATLRLVSRVLGLGRADTGRGILAEAAAAVRGRSEACLPRLISGVLRPRLSPPQGHVGGVSRHGRAAT